MEKVLEIEALQTTHTHSLCNLIEKNLTLEAFSSNLTDQLKTLESQHLASIS